MVVIINISKRTAENDGSPGLRGGGRRGNGDCVEDGKRSTGCRSHEHSHVTRGRSVVGVETGQRSSSYVHQSSAAGCCFRQTVYHGPQ